MLLWTALGCGFTAFVGYASLVWNAPFFLRVLGMTREELSIWYALAIGLGIGLGTWASGALTDMLVKRSKVWFALMPAIAMAAAAPFWYFYTQQSEWEMAIIILSVPLFLTIMYLAPALALVQNSVKPSQRTMSGAILLMILNRIGLGGGPTLVGRCPPTSPPTKVAAGGMEAAAAAAAQGCATPCYWMTPFYAVAVVFLLMEMMAINREVKAGGPVRDGGFRARPGARGRRHRGPLLPVPGSRLPQRHREHEPASARSAAPRWRTRSRRGSMSSSRWRRPCSRSGVVWLLC